MKNSAGNFPTANANLPKICTLILPFGNLHEVIGCSYNIYVFYDLRMSKKLLSGPKIGDFSTASVDRAFLLIS